MLCERFVVCVVLLFACATVTIASDSEDDSLKEFEERIDRLRRSLEDGVGEGDNDDNDDDDDDNGIPNEASGEDSILPNNREEKSKSVTNAENSCCKTGESMAALGLDCSKTNFLQMTRRQKIRVLGSIFHDLGITITDETRVTLYTPFRLCLMKDARSLTKCCRVSRRVNKGRHSNKDIGSRVRSDRFGGFDRRFGASLNRFDNQGPCRHRRCPVRPSGNNDRRRYRHNSPFRG